MSKIINKIKAKLEENIKSYKALLKRIFFYFNRDPKLFFYSSDIIIKKLISNQNKKYFQTSDSNKTAIDLIDSTYLYKDVISFPLKKGNSAQDYIGGLVDSTSMRLLEKSIYCHWGNGKMQSMSDL